MVGVQESLSVVVVVRAKALEGREPVLELQVVLWFCGGSTEEALPGVQQRAGKQCPASPWAGGTGVGSNARAWAGAEELGKLCGGL